MCYLEGDKVNNVAIRNKYSTLVHFVVIVSIAHAKNITSPQHMW